jgi:hypothetical protein
MRLKFAGVAMAGSLFFATTESAVAHHSFSVEFDRDKCMDMAGTLTGLEWENPHAWLLVTVNGPDGKPVTWRLEMITPNALRRNGSGREVFEAALNKPMHARACEARPAFGANKGAAEYIKLADGLIRIVGQVVEPDLTPEKLSFWDK